MSSIHRRSNNYPCLVIFCICFVGILHSEEVRTWTSANGKQSFSAEFISRNEKQVTLKLSNEKELTFDIKKLHKGDQSWLELNQPYPPKKRIPINFDTKNAVFDQLAFGDTHEIVTAKLTNSKFITTSLDATYFARTGLNGIFHTREKIGGLKCYLYFEWDDDGKLKEISLQTEDISIEEYSKKLSPCWNEFIKMTIPIYGKPKMASDLINPKEIDDGQMLTSHYWKIESGGIIQIGSGRVEESYQAVLRFTADTPA